MKTSIFKLLIFLLLMEGLSFVSIGNNLQVSNVKLMGQNTIEGINHVLNFTFVKFDLTWENSWRTSSSPNNWDAAWVFVKFRIGEGEWQHAKLNDTGHSTGTGTPSTIRVGLSNEISPYHSINNPGIGVFIYRSEDGNGTFSINSALLRWNYGQNGIADDASIEIKVFAFEMVYVPEGAFKLGSGGTESGSLTDGSWVSGATIPFEINSENAVDIGSEAGKLWGTSVSGDNTIGDSGTLPEQFPKGFQAFYCMKYSVSQQQYVDFLNSLTQEQATIHKYNKTGTDRRYEITGTEVGSYQTTNPYVPCNWMSWDDCTFFADWAGLRPMTELEYEKACRGTSNPVANEYAWGTANITTGKYTLANPGTVNESIATNYNTSGTEGNANYQTTIPTGYEGPLRSGIFAISNSSRVKAGASYYGIMELSGNLWKRIVTIGNSNGRLFTGLHGDGILIGTSHNVTAWPVGLTAIGAGYRGGAWGAVATSLRVSDRTYSVLTNPNRTLSYGFMGVHSAPLIIY